MIQLKIFITFTLTLFIFGCDFYHENKNDQKINITKDKYQLAIVPNYIFTNNNLGNGISVEDARKQNLIDNELIVEGFIGGRREPFSKNRASFILGDNSLQTCDKIPVDNCPTPWDACCEDRKKIISGCLNVQIKDENSSLIRGNLNGVGGLSPGVKIKIKGIVDSSSLPNSMVLNVQRIQIL